MSIAVGTYIKRVVSIIVKSLYKNVHLKYNYTRIHTGTHIHVTLDSISK